MVEVNITYETLFDLLRREKNRAELQTLEKDFYKQVFEYVNAKAASLDTPSATTSASEKEKLNIQIRNAKKIIKELYELREKKIVLLAINKVKTGSMLINTQSLLTNEQELYGQTADLLKKYKTKTLHFNPENIEVKKEPTQSEKPKTQTEKDKYEIEFITNLPKFVGQDGKIYGPFEKNKTQQLPAQIAKLLIEKNKAKRI